MRLRANLVSVVAFLILALTSFHAADTLPAQLSDAAYWKLISDFSEPDGYYQYTVITSNETAYQEVLPQLTKAIAPGGAYLGVGPEQNFTYIAALRPKIAFIIDIRREMLLEHLLYKAIFEMSADRADVCRQFVFQGTASATDGGLLCRDDLSGLCRSPGQSGTG